MRKQQGINRSNTPYQRQRRAEKAEKLQQQASVTVTKILKPQEHTEEKKPLIGDTQANSELGKDEQRGKEKSLPRRKQAKSAGYFNISTIAKFFILFISLWINFRTSSNSDSDINKVPDKLGTDDLLEDKPKFGMKKQDDMISPEFPSVVVSSLPESEVLLQTESDSVIESKQNTKTMIAELNKLISEVCVINSQYADIKNSVLPVQQATQLIVKALPQTMRPSELLKLFNTIKKMGIILRIEYSETLETLGRCYPDEHLIEIHSSVLSSARAANGILTRLAKQMQHYRVALARQILYAFGDAKTPVAIPYISKEEENVLTVAIHEGLSKLFSSLSSSFSRQGMINEPEKLATIDLIFGHDLPFIRELRDTFKISPDSLGFYQQRWEKSRDKSSASRFDLSLYDFQMENLDGNINSLQVFLPEEEHSLFDKWHQYHARFLDNAVRHITSATAYYEQVLTTGLPMDHYALGRQLFTPAQRKKDIAKLDKALALIEKAAAQDLGDAQNFLGILYLGRSGSFGVKKDMGKAVDFIKKAAEKGKVESQYNLGLLYIYEERALDINKDLKQAVDWLNKAADQGHKGAIELLKRPGFQHLEVRSGSAANHWAGQFAPPQATPPQTRSTFIGPQQEPAQPRNGIN